jgi:hypothetical protein
LFPIPSPSGICVTQERDKRIPGPESPTRVQTIFLTFLPKVKKENQKEKGVEEKKRKTDGIRSAFQPA